MRGCQARYDISVVSALSIAEPLRFSFATLLSPLIFASHYFHFDAFSAIFDSYAII